MADESSDRLITAIEDLTAYTKNLARDIQQLRSMLTEVINYMNEAESEVPEKMRRFIMYFHDVHDLINFWHELGLTPPLHIKQEVERCADRFRHMLEDAYADGGTFEKVRQDMSQREGNRYDWTKLLTTEKGK